MIFQFSLISLYCPKVFVRVEIKYTLVYYWILLELTYLIICSYNAYFLTLEFTFLVQMLSKFAAEYFP